MQKRLTYISYFFYGLAGLSLVFLLLIWTLGAFHYDIPAIIPDEAFEPLIGLIGVIFGGLGGLSTWMAQKVKALEASDQPAAAPSALPPRLRTDLLAALAVRRGHRRVDQLYRDTIG